MKDVLVLCYHAVSDRWPCELAVSPELLDEQVAGLKRRGYRATTFTRAITDPPWRRTMAITFDDAYRSTLEQGLPVLARHERPATVYAPTDFVGRDAPMSWPGIEQWADGPHRDELLCLGWDGLAELADAGWEVGSHTRSHPRLPRDGRRRAGPRAGRLARAHLRAARAPVRVDRLPLRRLRRSGGERHRGGGLPGRGHAHPPPAPGPPAELAAGGGVSGQPPDLLPAEDLGHPAQGQRGRGTGGAAEGLVAGPEAIRDGPAGRGRR